MRQLATDKVTPGMVTCSDVRAPGDLTGPPLVGRGVPVTESLRDRMLSAGVHHVYVDDDLSDGITVQQPITEATRNEAVRTTRDVFEQLQTDGGSIGRAEVQKVEKTVNAVIEEITQRRRLLICLTDLNVFGGDRFQDAVNTCLLGLTIATDYFGIHGWRDFKGRRRDDAISDRLQKLGVGMLLQDVGMLAIPESVRGRQGMLTAAEREQVQRHPLLGVEMLEGADASPLTKVTIQHHHERWNGSGYPKHLREDDIHDHGQVAGIADCWVSLTSSAQPDGGTMSPHAAWNTIVRSGGTLFSREIVRSFQNVVAPWGPGTSVRLSDGKYGIVRRTDPKNPNHPMIRITHDRDGLLFGDQVDVDLSVRRELRVTDVCDFLPTDGDLEDLVGV